MTLTISKEELNFWNIESDILVFQEIQSQLKKLKIVENDPKRERIAMKYNLF